MFDWNQKLETHEGYPVTHFRDSQYLPESIKYVYYIDADGEERSFCVFTSSGNSWSEIPSEKRSENEPPNCVRPARSDAEIANRLRELDAEYNILLTELLARGYTIVSKCGAELEPAPIGEIYKVDRVEI